jgi:hypothetical protein
MNVSLTLTPCDRARRPTRPGLGRIPSIGLILAAASTLAGCEERVVTAASVATVEVGPPEITLVEGDRTTASAVAREGGGRELPGRIVTWTVENPEVATVTSTGLVEGRAPGHTVIRATVENVSGTASVTVLASSTPPEQDGCVFRNRTFASNVDVPDGTSCVFTNVRIRGDLRLGRGASVAGVDLRVDGDVEGKAASGLTLTTSRIDGDLQFEGGGSVDVRQTLIEGNLQLASNDGRLLVEDNTVDGDVQVFRNRGGPFTIAGNTIDGNLQCKENDPAPTGGGNVVDGNKEDQCRTL